MNKLELELVAAIEKTYPSLKIPVIVIIVSKQEDSFEHISTYKQKEQIRGSALYRIYIRSRRIDSPILLLLLYDGIVTESIILYTFSDWKFKAASDGNINILVNSLFWALFEFCVPMSTLYVSFPVYDYPNKFR